MSMDLESKVDLEETSFDSSETYQPTEGEEFMNPPPACVFPQETGGVERRYFARKQRDA